MHKEQAKLNRYGRTEVIGHIVGPVITAVIFFIFAGRADLFRAWIWAGLTLAYYCGGMVVIYLVNPRLLNERGDWKKKKDTKRWDKIMLWIFGSVGLYGHTILMALDVGRFGWSDMSFWFILPGLVLYTGTFNLVYWSMAVNTHFETTVRVQHERDHKVVSRGPYQIVRHPGYAGLILSNFASTMIIGSVYGFLTALATFIILFIRTWLEDRTLMTELQGYREYAAKTRYRLIPLIW
jgi:protein-S-isoprenylcysteine O-methyltransferase Ste14